MYFIFLHIFSKNLITNLMKKTIQQFNKLITLNLVRFGSV